MRLENYDYSSNGAYFVTICACDRAARFREDEKAIIVRELNALPRRFSGVTIDTHAIMPDHLHVIFLFVECNWSLPRVVQAFKSLSTAGIKEHSPRWRVWQRGYYDRIIRNDQKLAALREYIVNNPIAADLNRS